MSDFKTTPIKNSYELMIDRLKAVISDKDAELARLKAREKVLIDLICEAAPLAWAGSPQYYDHAVAWDERARQILDDYFDGQFERHHLGDGK